MFRNLQQNEFSNESTSRLLEPSLNMLHRAIACPTPLMSELKLKPPDKETRVLNMCSYLYQTKTPPCKPEQRQTGLQTTHPRPPTRLRGPGSRRRTARHQPPPSSLRPPHAPRATAKRVAAGPARRAGAICRAAPPPHAVARAGPPKRHSVRPPRHAGGGQNGGRKKDSSVVDPCCAAGRAARLPPPIPPPL